ncbi:MAG: hypothetical protein RR619_12510 [Raoultibacter sp.]
MTLIRPAVLLIDLNEYSSGSGLEEVAKSWDKKVRTNKDAETQWCSSVRD